jgi:signal transduction histidine kinase
VADTRGGPYDDLPDGVLVTDPTGLVTEANGAALRLLGQSADATLGRALADVLPLTDDQDRDWWACTDPWSGLSSRTRQPERRLTLPDGRALLVTAAYVRDDGHRLQRFVVVLRDDRSRERIDRSRADLVSTVAHELRSPLTSVKGFTATLLAKWDRFHDEQKKVMLETVNADADRVTRLLTELLDVSRIDAGRIEVRRQVIDLERAVRKAVEGRVASGESPDRFVVDVRGPIGELWADPDKIDQVVGNLVENALRHGEGTVTVRLGPSDELGEGGAELVVEDEGKGIPEEAAARVFRKFWRGDRRGGTGLGLYIVKGMIEAHGGRVEVRRAPSGGAAFWLLLPAGTPSFL